VTAAAHPKLDVLAVGAHPDDVELACGGTLALAARRGRAVGVVHLTGGESGTRGTLEERRNEAAAAARALGAASLDLLDCGDGELRTGRAEEDALIRLLRRYRPEVVLSPPPEDRHPDHGRAHRLVAAAAFYAGLAGRRLAGEDAGLPPHRPAAVYHYMQHDSFDPAFVVDVTEAWDAKKAALACYASQLQVPAEWHGGETGRSAGAERDEPVTKVATREFSLAVEGRMRHFGLLIGAALGEPFGAKLPLAVRDLLGVLPGGIR
jgi:bacillithiol biosynthesis deacetylase BshB1